VRLRGFELPAGSKVLSRAAQPALRLAFYGDSITQGTNVLCPVSGSDCADATLDYAWLVARHFRAALDQVGFGSQGVTRGGNGNVPAAGRALAYNFERSLASRRPADVVVVNQGTNDAIAGESAAEIESAYSDYLKKLRERYPRAQIMALEPFGFLGIAFPSATDAVKAAVRRSHDPRIHYVSTRGWLGPTDFTEGLHPNTAGHRKAAARLVDVMQDLIS